MKLRIRGNSLRLRLTKAEVAQIAEGQSVMESIFFSAGPSLHYALRPSREAERLEAHYEGHTVTVLLPFEQAVAWARSAEIALRAESQSPFLLVEKDFQCLKPRLHEAEDESDLYFNPNELHGTCR